MKTAFIYARVSSDEQAKNGVSIEVQEALCSRWAKENEYNVLGVFKDEGRSGSNTNRPDLQEMITGCTLDSHPDIIIVQDTDRLARNTLDHLNIKALLETNGVRIVSISQPMIDNSPEGNMIDTMIASFNAFQSQRSYHRKPPQLSLFI